jgi:hypothetical protein
MSRHDDDASKSLCSSMKYVSAYAQSGSAV